MRRGIVLLLALTCALSVAASEITRHSVLAAMNSYRLQHGATPLNEDVRLDAAADDRIRDMEELGYWAHESPDGRNPFTWFRPHGYQYRFAGENLASGFETTEVLVDAWMESPGHRDNILSPNYSDCGIAVIDGSTTGRTTGKSIVVLFGGPLPSQPDADAKK